MRCCPRCDPRRGFLVGDAPRKAAAAGRGLTAAPRLAHGGPRCRVRPGHDADSEHVLSAEPWAGDARRILVTFGRSFLTLELARLLHAAGHVVHVTDSVRFPISRYSGAVAGFHRVPPPADDPYVYGRALSRLTRELDIDLLIPMHEETAVLAGLRAEFPDRCRLFLTDFDVDIALHHKLRFQQLLRDTGLPVLDFAAVTGPQDLTALDFPDRYVLKPVFSRGSQEIHVVSPGDAVGSLPGSRPSPEQPWIAQGWAEGERFYTYSICNQGSLDAHATYPVDFAIEGRSSITFAPVEDPEVTAWVAAFVRRIGYTGQIGFDMVRTPDGVLYCIECNPRSTAGIMLFADGDRVDRAFLGHAPATITPRPGATKQIGMGMLLYGWRRSALPGNSPRRFLRTFLRTPDVVVRRSDPGPALALPLALADIWWHGHTEHVSLAEAFMRDHEWSSTTL